jgi:bifunctional enzyme CysN/CysC/sulfate adenylyltransferase subunit 1
VPGLVRALQLAGVIAVTARVLDKSTVAAIESFAEGDLVLGEGLEDGEVLRIVGVSE